MSVLGDHRNGGGGPHGGRAPAGEVAGDDVEVEPFVGADPDASPGVDGGAVGGAGPVGDERLGGDGHPGHAGVDGHGGGAGEAAAHRDRRQVFARDGVDGHVAGHVDVCVLADPGLGVFGDHFDVHPGAHTRSPADRQRTGDGEYVGVVGGGYDDAGARHRRSSDRHPIVDVGLGDAGENVDDHRTGHAGIAASGASDGQEQDVLGLGGAHFHSGQSRGADARARSDVGVDGGGLDQDRGGHSDTGRAAKGQSTGEQLDVLGIVRGGDRHVAAGVEGGPGAAGDEGLGVVVEHDDDE